MPSRVSINIPNVVFLIFLFLPLIGVEQTLIFIVVAKFINVIAYTLICYVLVKTDVKFLIVIGIALLIKMFYLILGYEIFQILFWSCATVLIGSFSALYYITAPEKFRHLVNIYLLISVPIVVLQALGVFDFLHYWNTLFFVCDEALNCECKIEIINTIGKAFIDLEVRPEQYRPPGLFHSQAILGAFLAFSLVLNVYPSVSKLSISLIACIIVIVFGMSKITQIQLVMLVGLIFIQYGLPGLTKSTKIILVWISVLFIYNTLVPGLIYFQLSIDQYIFSAGTRMLDFYSYLMGHDFETVMENKQAVRELTNVGVYVATESDRGGLSGISILVWFLPILALLLYKVKAFYNRQHSGTFFLKRKLPWEMYIALILIFATQLMVTNTFGTQFVMYFWGLLIVPVFCSRTLLLNKFRRVYKLNFS